MLRTMNTAANTMGQIQSQLDIIGNNMANINTHGYKAQQAGFRELLFQQFNNERVDVDRAPRVSAGGIRYGVGAMIGQSKMKWAAGSVQTTDRPLDFSLLTPKNYFRIGYANEQAGQTVDQVQFTRKGNFYLSPVNANQMQLVNEEGRPVLDATNRPIIVSKDVRDVSLQADGSLQFAMNDGRIETASLGITYIARPDLLEKQGESNLALPRNFDQLGINENQVFTDLTPAQAAAVEMRQSALEMSNVQMEEEMTELINAQRHYQMNARTITMADQMLGLINGIR